MNIFKRKPKQKTEIVGIHTRSSQISLEQWRSNKALVSIAIRFLNDPEFQSMLDVLKNSLYQRYSVAAGNDPNELALTQCRMEGYATCLAKLESMGKFQEPTVPEQETFEPPEPPSFSSATEIEQ